MMSNDDSGSLEFQLLDLHLRRLDERQAAGLEDAVAHSPELAGQSRALRDLLGVLDRYEAPEPPEDLVDAVLARVNEAARGGPAAIPFPGPAQTLPSGSTHDLSSSPVLSLRELIAIAACITLFIGVFVPGYYKARSAANRNQCRRHIATLYGGMSSYAAANQGHLPYAGYVPGGSWLFTRQASVPRASNTRHMFLLLRGKYVTDRDFLCPASPEARPMLADDYREFTDFTDPSNNSYSFIYMNLPAPVRMENHQTPSSGQIAYAGDRNPLFDTRSASRISPFNDRSFNSPAHDNGAGQNVLSANGQTFWADNPRVGVDKDNIYCSGERTCYEGTEQPSFPTDSFIVP